MSARSTPKPSLVDADAFLRLVRETMGDVAQYAWSIEELAHGRARIRLRFDPKQLRPGGTVSGPTMFALADLGLYAATMSVVGFQPLAVTTDVTMHFLRRPRPADLVCEARVLKAGKRLVVGEASVFSDGDEEPVAHFVGSYSVPPASK